MRCTAAEGPGHDGVTVMTSAAVINAMVRDKAIVNYNIAEGGGLHCPLCGEWCPVSTGGTAGPSGVRLNCTCGTITILPRAPLARAIAKRTADV